MFLQIYRGAGGTDNGPYSLARPYLESHPSDIATYMDLLWGQRDTAKIPYTTGISAMPENEKPPGEFVPDHLIYAYMIENTRIYEIFEKVIFEYLHGEKLGFPMSAGTYQWLRATEELFYRNTSNYFIQSFLSNIRSDIRSLRRNSYFRMFGLDLNHGTGNTSNYPYHKPQVANKDFVALFEEFLSEVWIGIANATNTVGTNPTDDPKMDNLIRRLKEILTARRQHGNLAREEFYHIATMSWLHLTLLVDDAPIVQDMGIAAQSPAERLRQIGERVGYPTHPKADAFFEMAEKIATILTIIERVQINSQMFYAPPPNGVLRSEAETVITQWSIATGRDIKALKARPASIGLQAGHAVGAVALATR